MSKAILAIDVAILVPEPVASRAREISLALAAGQQGALRLDDTHLPHITLAQQFVERSRLAESFEELDRLLRREPALVLRIAGASADRGTVSLAVDLSPDLLRVHEAIMDVIEPFESPEGDADAFMAADGEVARTRDVDWVRNYRELSAYTHFRPHVTAGHGDRAPQVPPVEFRANRIAACHLGRFCTCRAILRDWVLASGPA